MSHVDEGTLHAYLDGALEAVCSEREAELVREHLASCPECAARLEEARQIRGDAMAVLATADPGPIEPPPLEDLREMAQARRKDGSSAGGTTSYLRQLAWAASIVVALGAGWSARQLSLPNAAFRPVPQGPAVGTEPSGDPVGNGSGVDAMAPDTMEPETPPLDAPARERGVEDGTMLRFGGLTVDFGARSATRDGEDVGLTPREFELLEFFSMNEGTALRRARLLAQIWRDEEVVSRVIDMAVLGLRKKIEPDPANPRHIVSVRGVGYRFSRRG